MYSTDSQLELLSSVLLCIYQFTELAKYHVLDNQDDPDLENRGRRGSYEAGGIMSADTLSLVLGRVLVSITGFVKQHPADCEKVWC